MIKKAPLPVYDTAVNAEHTGDVIWQTALNVIGKGEAEIHFGGNVNGTFEIRITLDGNVLANGLISWDWANVDYVFEVKWNVSLLVEYRVNNGARTAYIDIAYYNR